MIDLSVVEKLLKLATNHAASEEERRTASVLIANWLQEHKVLPDYRRLLLEEEKRKDLTPVGYAAERAEWDQIAHEMISLFHLANSPSFHRPTVAEVNEMQRRRMYQRHERPMTTAEVFKELGKLAPEKTLNFD